MTTSKTPVEPLLTGVALTTFRLNGQFLAVSEQLSRRVGLTAARWQVLGAVLEQPLSVAGIARVMGITRQSVQRVADLLVDEGLAEYVTNPAHRRAKLVRPTDDGHATVKRITPGHAELARQLADELGVKQFQLTLDVVTRLSEAMEAVIARRDP